MEQTKEGIKSRTIAKKLIEKGRLKTNEHEVLRQILKTGYIEISGVLINAIFHQTKLRTCKDARRFYLSGCETKKNVNGGAIVFFTEEPIVLKRTSCDVCGSRDTIEAPSMGRNCNRCNPPPLAQ